MKKFLSIIALLAVVLFSAFAATSCLEDPKGPDTPDPGTPPTSEKNIDVPVKDANLSKLIGEGGKIYVTSLGQADRDYIKDLTEEAYGEENIIYNNVLTADEVSEGDLVIAVIGYTSKGISTEITQTGEVLRAQAFSEKAGINFVLVQLSGKSRRGESTDPIIEKAVVGADLVLIYDAGNDKGADFDNKYSSVWCVNKPLYLFSDETEMVSYFEEIIK